MHNTIEDGGNAFPAEMRRSGMSLRDWFAGMALQGCLANPECGGSNAQLAKDCFTIADAMLAARKEDAE